MSLTVICGMPACRVVQEILNGGTKEAFYIRVAGSCCVSCSAVGNICFLKPGAMVSTFWRDKKGLILAPIAWANELYGSFS